MEVRAPRGIRLRITAIAVAAVALVLLAAGSALLFSQRRILTNNLDELLSTNNQGIEQAYANRSLTTTITGQGDEDAIAQVVDREGRIVASTRNIAFEPPLAASPASGTRVRTVRVAFDESSYRLLSRSVGDIVIHTGTPIDDVDESVAALRTNLFIAIPAVTALLGLLVWWLVGRTLRPVEQIRAEVATITGQSLHRRVSEPRADDEIARLAQTMNAMLDRLEDASLREQQMVADASHELRSPLTRMRAELEVDLAHPQTADLEATHRSVLDEIETLQGLVDDLLALAAGDAHNDVRRSSAVVDLADVAMNEAQLLRASTRVHVDTERVRPAPVRGDSRQLARAVRNLCDNAARHARSRIALATEQRDGVVTVVVTDDGPGIPRHERTRVFERFARLDESRQTATGGFGLGLAIVHDVVRRHGGTVAVDDAEGEGARFVITLPAAAPQ